MMGAVVGLLLPAVAVWLSILALQLHRAIGSRAVIVAVAGCAGLGLSSVSTMWLVALGVVIGPRFVAADALLWIAIGAVAWWRLRRHGLACEWRSGAPASARRLTTTDWLVRVLFGVVAVVAAATAVAEYIAAPHGQWDAWAIWNQKARFLFRGGDEWTAVLAIDWSNPSHPLLVPTAVARLWAYAGAELTIVPAMLGVVFGAAIVAVVMGALDVRRTRAWIAGSVVLAPGTFVQQIVSQQADVPFALFMVSTLVMLRADKIASWARVARWTRTVAPRRHARQYGCMDEERRCPVGCRLSAVRRVDGRSRRTVPSNGMVGDRRCTGAADSCVVQADCRACSTAVLVGDPDVRDARGGPLRARTSRHRRCADLAARERLGRPDGNGRGASGSGGRGPRCRHAYRSVDARDAGCRWRHARWLLRHLPPDTARCRVSRFDDVRSADGPDLAVVGTCRIFHGRWTGRRPTARGARPVESRDEE